MSAGDGTVVPGWERVITRFERAVVVRVQRRQVTLGDEALLARQATAVVEHTPVEGPVIPAVVAEDHCAPEVNLVKNVADPLIDPQDGTCLHAWRVVSQTRISVGAVPAGAGIAG